MEPKHIKPLIVIVGETASGKSSLALNLAKKFNGEIINADSWSVYKGFDIGTAKPSPSDKEEVKHHLYDIADPLKGFNAAQYQRLAKRKIDEIHKLGKIPFLVGGTGLYIDCVLYDYSFLPENDPKLRLKYNAMHLNDLVGEVNELGYEAEGVDLRNKRRVIRLLENKGLKPSQRPLRRNTLIIGTKISQEKLEKNIEKRVNKMMKDGLSAEVQKLSTIYSWDIEPMKGISYREFKSYFDGQATITETINVIIKDSLNLAKKQRTWFKRNKSIQWIDNSNDSVGLITTFLNNLSGN